MSINPTGYRVECDTGNPLPRQCRATIEADSYFGPNGIYALMNAQGWQRGVCKDGRQAKRGGRDYCPLHRVGEEELR